MKIKRLGQLGMLLAALLLGSTPVKAGTFVSDSVKLNGHVRHFDMYLPEGIKADAPLVVYIHGYGGGIERDNYMVGEADKQGFAVCIPEGLKDPVGKRSWNVGYPFQKGWKVNDVKEVQQIAQQAQKKYRLSKVNTFLTGMSNGGEMCYITAFSDQSTFRAVAPIAGLTMKWFFDKLPGTKPIPLMEVHGTEDRVSEWTGDLTNAGGWGAYLSVPIAVGYWVAKDRCTHETVTEMPSRDPSSGHRIIKHEYTGGPQGYDVWLYQVIGGTHCTHTGDLDTGAEVWKFFSKYLK
jgi:polyhydroxybutyrate depolymerase